nr:immunoglobulin light chain junction region [Macaca mulatta]MOX88277.1 immunoglobulin light chain junction region [Macaca mulatta]MOX88370.1 immunoglobulin light chain junction region [Macaca mulatta]MOX89415.1 immunoglobulin light chain junction region [Macaca mulatta]MOX89863.1 immunoglobulin light chain junction region [Macaca mulatta]
CLQQKALPLYTY